MEWAAASRPHMAGTESGDACMVRPVEHGLLIAVADGLGRGPDAARVARQALRTVENSTRTSPAELLEQCHAAMHGTRGAVRSERARRLVSTLLAGVTSRG